MAYYKYQYFNVCLELSSCYTINRQASKAAEATSKLILFEVEVGFTDILSGSGGDTRESRVSMSSNNRRYSSSPIC